jgi:hypothetical protein
MARKALGDFDNDGDVDGRDFLVWQRDPHVGDLADWQENYGAGALASAAAVPEPCCLMLAAALPISATMRRRTAPPVAIASNIIRF